jgi:hypothetical protein
MRSQFIHKKVEVAGQMRHVSTINRLDQSVTVYENNRLVRYSLSEVNKADLAIAMQSQNIGTL